MRLPTNRSNHRGVPRTKIERTISIQLIHTYGVVDPTGLRRPELGATGVERREEQPFGVDEIGSKERERGGNPSGKNNFNLVLKGCPHLLYLLGRGRGASLEEGAALGAAP